MDSFTLIGTVILVVLSITTHEAAHAWVADRCGDPTARLMGRVTLNPFPHIDPIMTVLLPGFLLLSGSRFLFGGAKPVPVDLRRLRNPRRDWALVGAAGPAANILIAVACAGLLSLLLHTGFFSETSRGAQVLVIGIYANALLATFNLIPIPPLDGSRVVTYFLRGEALRAFMRLERYGLLIIVGLIFMVDGFSHVLWGAILGLMYFISGLFGIAGEVQHILYSVLTS